MVSCGEASLTDLKLEEKLKIGTVLRELARAQRQGQLAARERQEYQARLSNLRGQNEIIIKVSVSLVKSRPFDTTL